MSQRNPEIELVAIEGKKDRDDKKSDKKDKKGKGRSRAAVANEAAPAPPPRDPESQLELETIFQELSRVCATKYDGAGKYDRAAMNIACKAILEAHQVVPSFKQPHKGLLRTSVGWVDKSTNVATSMDGYINQVLELHDVWKILNDNGFYWKQWRNYMIQSGPNLNLSLKATQATVDTYLGDTLLTSSWTNFSFNVAILAVSALVTLINGWAVWSESLAAKSEKTTSKSLKKINAPRPVPTMSLAQPVEVVSGSRFTTFGGRKFHSRPTDPILAKTISADAQDGDPYQVALQAQGDAQTVRLNADRWQKFGSLILIFVLAITSGVEFELNRKLGSSSSSSTATPNPTSTGTPSAETYTTWGFSLAIINIAAALIIPLVFKALQWREEGATRTMQNSQKVLDNLDPTKKSPKLNRR